MYLYSAQVRLGPLNVCVRKHWALPEPLYDNFYKLFAFLVTSAFIYILHSAGSNSCVLHPVQEIFR